MRISKIILIMAAGAFAAAAGLLTGCEYGFSSEEEKIDFILPVWEEAYLELSRWKICARSADYETDFYLPAKSRGFSFTAKRNLPFCVTAAPLTLLSDGTETSFFKPAGAVYPYSAGGDFYSGTSECLLTWEAGFTASTMQKIINSKKQSGISSQAVNAFLMEFNWKKMQEKISQNIFDSISSFENQAGETKPKFYNPWQIDSFTLLDNLTFAVFESRYLNTNYIFSVTKETAQVPAGSQCLSSFIPENQIVQKYGALALKKKTPQAWLLDNTYALTLTATSAKNVSAGLTYMPILIEDYEHPE